MFALQHNSDIASLHDNLKTKMAAIVNKAYFWPSAKNFQSFRLRPEAGRFVRWFPIPRVRPVLWCQYLRGLLYYLLLYFSIYFLKRIWVNSSLGNWILGSRNTGNRLSECFILKISCGSMPCCAKKCDIRCFQKYVHYFSKLSKPCGGQ